MSAHRPSSASAVRHHGRRQPIKGQAHPDISGDGPSTPGKSDSLRDRLAAFMWDQGPSSPVAAPSTPATTTQVRDVRSGRSSAEARLAPITVARKSPPSRSPPEPSPPGLTGESPGLQKQRPTSETVHFTFQAHEYSSPLMPASSGRGGLDPGSPPGRPPLFRSPSNASLSATPVEGKTVAPAPKRASPALVGHPLFMEPASSPVKPQRRASSRDVSYLADTNTKGEVQAAGPRRGSTPSPFPSPLPSPLTTPPLRRGSIDALPEDAIPASRIPKQFHIVQVTDKAPQEEPVRVGVVVVLLCCVCVLSSVERALVLKTSVCEGVRVKSACVSSPLPSAVAGAVDAAV